MNELTTRKERSMAGNTAELHTEARALFERAERSLAKLSKRLPVIVEGIIRNGDATAIGGLDQMELQAVARSQPGDAYLIVVRAHKAFYEASKAAGLENPPLVGDDDIAINSSGR